MPEHVDRLWEKSQIDGQANVGWRDAHRWSTARFRGNGNKSVQEPGPEQPSHYLWLEERET